MDSMNLRTLLKFQSTNKKYAKKSDTSSEEIQRSNFIRILQYFESKIESKKVWTKESNYYTLLLFDFLIAI
jgi:hypothetical protein